MWLAQGTDRMRPCKGACGHEHRRDPAQADLCFWHIHVGDRVFCFKLPRVKGL